MSEPILWANRHHPRQVTRELPGGKIVIDKYPNTAPPPDGHPLQGQNVQRWTSMLRAEGIVVRAVYTGGSADYDGDHARYGRPMKARQRALGWMPYGECPRALVAANMVLNRQLCPENRTGDPCERGTYDDGEGRRAFGPCVHMRREKLYRAAQHAAVEAHRTKQFQPEADKLLADTAAKMANSGEQNTAIIANLADTLAKLVGPNWPMSKPAMQPAEFDAQLAAQVAEISDEDRLRAADAEAYAELDAATKPKGKSK